MFEANLACFMHLNQRLVSGQRCAAGWKAQNERTIGGRFERVNAVYDMASGPFTNLFCSCQGNQSHCSPQSLSRRVGGWLRNLILKRNLETFRPDQSVLIF